MDPAGFFHGTTLRISDPAIDAWHILWSDPVKQYFSRQIGRADGSDIVQLGHNDAGEPTRWRFVDITDQSFRWLGESQSTPARPGPWKHASSPAGSASRQSSPLDHASFGVRDLARSKQFYDAVLAALGYRLHYQDDAMLGYGAEEPALWLHRTENPVPATRSGLHLSFSAPTQDSVMHSMPRRWRRAGRTTARWAAAGLW